MHYADGARGKYSFHLHKYRSRQILGSILYPIFGLLMLSLLAWNYSFGWVDAHGLVSKATDRVSSFKIETILGERGGGGGEEKTSKYLLRRRLISTFLESTRNGTNAIPAESLPLNTTEESGSPADPFKEFDAFMGVMQMFAVVNDMDYVMITFKDLDPADFDRPDLHKYATSNFMKYNMYDDDMKKRTSYINDDILKFYICSNYMEEGAIDLQVHKCTKEDLFVFNKKSLVDAIDLDVDIEHPPRALPSSSFSKKKREPVTLS